MLTLVLIPRWPAIESWPLCGSTCTVGVSVTKSWNRRPLIGRFPMAVSSSVDVRTDELVSTAVAPPSTVTASWIPPTLSAVFTLTSDPTVTLMALCFAGWKPVRDAVTS